MVNINTRQEAIEALCQPATPHHFTIGPARFILDDGTLLYRCRIGVAWAKVRHPLYTSNILLLGEEESSKDSWDMKGVQYCLLEREATKEERRRYALHPLYSPLVCMELLEVVREEVDMGIVVLSRTGKNTYYVSVI